MWAPRGSYHQEHVLKHLERHLLSLTPGRPRRILLCDVYGAHMDDAIVEATAEATRWHSAAVVAQASCNATTRTCTNA